MQFESRFFIEKCNLSPDIFKLKIGILILQATPLQHQFLAIRHI